MLDSTELRMCVMAEYGFYAKTIQKSVRKYNGERFSTATIYRTLKKNGIKIGDYRRGKGQFAEAAMKSVNKRVK